MDNPMTTIVGCSFKIRLVVSAPSHPGMFMSTNDDVGDKRAGQLERLRSRRSLSNHPHVVVLPQ